MAKEEEVAQPMSPIKLISVMKYTNIEYRFRLVMRHYLGSRIVSNQVRIMIISIETQKNALKFYGPWAGLKNQESHPHHFHEAADGPLPNPLLTYFL
ncbi:MAG: hypothetical protein HN505_10050 [Verrucomicrobia bacterium]|nr:hypothetical protein [Verrucomicrobiota bacterium]